VAKVSNIVAKYVESESVNGNIDSQTYMQIFYTNAWPSDAKSYVDKTFY